MGIILVIDDQPHTQMHVIRTLKGFGYRIKTLSDAALSEMNALDRMIEKIRPTMVLINRQPIGFDSISVFMHLKEKNPSLPVLLYALKSDTAIESLSQAISMVLNEREKATLKIQQRGPFRSERPLRRV